MTVTFSRRYAIIGVKCSMRMGDVVVSFEAGAELDILELDIGIDEGGEVLAFSAEGYIRNVEPDTLQQFADESLVPTEIHFRHGDG